MQVPRRCLFAHGLNSTVDAQHCDMTRFGGLFKFRVKVKNVTAETDL